MAIFSLEFLTPLKRKTPKHNAFKRKRSVKHGAAVVCVALFTTACSSKYALEPTPLEHIEQPSASVETIWRKNLGRGFESTVNRIALARSQNQLFAVNGRGTITARDIATGDTLWQTTSKTPITGGVSAGYGTVVGVTEKGTVTALSAQDGAVLWQHDVQAEVYAAPVIDDSKVYVQSVDNQIFALDRSTGERVWQYSQSMPLISLWGSSQPQLFNDWLVAGLANGKLVAIDKITGKEAWERPIGIAKGSSDLEQLVDLDSQFLIQDGMLWAASYQENLIAMSLLDGSLQWFQPIASFTDIVFNQGTLVVADNRSVLHGMSAYSGDAFWQSEALKGRKIHALAAVDSVILAIDFEGYLHILDYTSGAIIARKALSGDGVVGAPLVDDGVVYLLTRDSVLHALDIRAVVSDNADSEATDNESLEDSMLTRPLFSEGLFAVPELDDAQTQ